MGRLAGASLAEPTSLCPVMSEAGMETLEDEWQSISEIASTCNTILESLSREGEATEGECCGEEPGGGSYFLYQSAVPLSPQDSPSQRVEIPGEPQNLMLSKAPHPDLFPSLCLCDHHLCPFSGLKHRHMSEKTGGPPPVGLGPAVVLTAA